MAGARVEIAFKLLSGTSDLSIESIEAEGVPPGLGHEPQAVKAGNFLFFSTVAPFDHSGSLEESTQRHPSFPFYGQPPKLEMRYMLDSQDLRRGHVPRSDLPPAGFPRRFHILRPIDRGVGSPLRR